MERFNAGSSEVISTSCNCPLLGGLRSTDCAHCPTSHAESPGAGMVPQITLFHSGGSPLPSVTLTAIPVWVDAFAAPSYTLIHAMLLTSCIHSDTIILGACVSPRDPRATTPQNSACTLSYHAPAPPRIDLPSLDSPGRSLLRGSVFSPFVPEGGYPEPYTGSQDIQPAQS